MYLLRSFFHNFFYSRYFSFFLNYIVIQNVITIGILPVYASWGIPFSTLLWFGNLFFLPFLTIYLTVSVIILILFFFQSFSLVLIRVHNIVIDVWMTILYMLSKYIPYGEFSYVDYAPYSYIVCWSTVIFLLWLRRKSYSILFRAAISSSCCMIIILCAVLLPPFQMVHIDCEGTFPESYIMMKNNVIIMSKKRVKKLAFEKVEYNYLRKIRKYFGLLKPSILFLNYSIKK